MAWGMLLLACAVAAQAQDPVRTDPQHFKVEYEDANMRVLRFRLPAGAKSPMHDLLERVTVVYRGARLRITHADGLIEEQATIAGMPMHRIAQQLAVENIDSVDYEAVITEFKHQFSELAAKKPGEKEEMHITARVERPATPAKPKPAPSKAAKAPEKEPEQETDEEAEIILPTPQPVKGLKKFSVNNADLHYVDFGQGVPVVFVHGVLEDYRTFEKQLGPFSRKFHTFSYSRLYHYPNLSTGKEKDYTYEQNVSDLSGFIKGLDLGAVHLVGHGYGAVVAAMLAQKHPEQVRSVTLVEPNLDGLLPEERAYAVRYARGEIFDIVHKALARERVESGIGIYVDWSSGTGAWDSLSPEEQTSRKENAHALNDYTIHPEAPKFGCAEVGAIKAPVLLMSGDAISPNMKLIMKRLGECIPGASTAVVPHTSQVLQRGNSAVFNQQVLEFLDRH